MATAMWTPRSIGFHAVALIVLLIVMTAVAIWFRLGPAVSSAAAR